MDEYRPYLFYHESREIEGVHGETFGILGLSDLEFRVILARRCVSKEGGDFWYEVRERGNFLGRVTLKEIPVSPEDAIRIIRATYEQVLV